MRYRDLAGKVEPFTRRKFLLRSAMLAGTLAFPMTALSDGAAHPADSEDKASDKIAGGAPQMRITGNDPEGKPFVKGRFASLHARDLANDPLPRAVATAHGRARVELAAEPVQFSMGLEVPGFGTVACYADNDGKGFSRAGEIDFIFEAAKTRLRRVQEASVLAKQSGVPEDPEFNRRMEAAAEAISPDDRRRKQLETYSSLAHSLHAGERLVLNAARHRIARMAAPRHEFLFGCSSTAWRLGPDYEKRFTELFNFATISWYVWGPEEPPEKRIDYTRMDQNLDWCLARKLIPKNFGYAYLVNGATPEWLRHWPYEKVLAEYKRVVTQTTRRYDGRVPYVEVINEAHDKSNLFHYSHEQILELTRETCRAAREGSPSVKRIINNCCLWAEYARRQNRDGSRLWSPFRYLADCERAGVEFEIVGLQLYYPQQDLFEIDRMLERFRKFNRPIHITEIACQSADGLDPASLRPKSLVPGWHGPWTETMQADWAEAIYTLCYSKPEFQAIGWWDFADIGGHFWPYGGLLHKDLSPKESYLRLMQLKKSCGL